MNDDSELLDPAIPQNASGAAAGDRSALTFLATLHHRWLAIVFLSAVACLLTKNDFVGAILLCIVPPLCAWNIARCERATRWGKRLARAFLGLISLGTLAASLDILPAAFNFFPQVPRVENRILSWYVCVFLSFAFGILPPYVFIADLRKRSRGEPADFAAPIGWTVIAVWGLCMFVGAAQLAAWLF